MLIGLGVSLGMLGIFVIFGICCYTCGKHRRKIAGQHGKDGKSTPYRRSMIYRLPRMIQSRYMRNSSTVGKRESPNSRVSRNILLFANYKYISLKVAHLIGFCTKSTTIHTMSIGDFKGHEEPCFAIT